MGEFLVLHKQFTKCCVHFNVFERQRHVIRLAVKMHSSGVDVDAFIEFIQHFFL